MKSAVLVLVLLTATFSLGQTVDASVCDILANPKSFDGKVVRIKGTVVAGFDEFTIRSSGCNYPVNAIWLAYPAGTNGKAGPAAFLQLQLSSNNPATAASVKRAPVTLDKNKDFKHFDSLLSTPAKVNGLCLACNRYTVTATLIGRLDGVPQTGVQRDGSGKPIAVQGFGNLNLYPARLVLQSVSEVTPQEIDYSKTGLTKDNSSDSGGGDPVAAAHRAATAFPSGSAAHEQVERAAAAFGKEGEDNGVEVGFGISNEVAKNDGAKSEHSSPDGLLFNCKFDMDRLKGDALSFAISHVGSEVADIRATQDATQLTPNALENRAWITTVLNAVAFGKHSLAVPGGYVLWNATWPQADASKFMTEAVEKYLKEWALLAP